MSTSTRSKGGSIVIRCRIHLTTFVRTIIFVWPVYTWSIGGVGHRFDCINFFVISVGRRMLDELGR